MTVLKQLNKETWTFIQMIKEIHIHNIQQPRKLPAVFAQKKRGRTVVEVPFVHIWDNFKWNLKFHGNITVVHGKDK